MTLFVVVGVNPVNKQEYLIETDDGFAEYSEALRLLDQVTRYDDGWSYYIGRVEKVAEE